MYDNENTVKASFDLNYVSEYLLQAQWAEFIELKEAIHEIAERINAPVTILDIGIGNARIPKHLSGIKDIWDKVAFYDGTDNAMACVEISNEEIDRLGIRDKTAAHFFDAANLANWQKKHDMVITTWFTAGNFYPDDSILHADFLFDGDINLSVAVAMGVGLCGPRRVPLAHLLINRNPLLETLVVKLRLDSLGLELRIGAEKNRGSLMKKYPKLEKVFHPSPRRA